MNSRKICSSTVVCQTLFGAFILAPLILGSGCRKAGISGTDSEVTFSGTVEARYHSADGTATPLAGATLLLDNFNLKTDSSGAFTFSSVTKGTHKLRITAPDIIPIDTSVTIEGSGPANFEFVFYRFGGIVAIYNSNPYSPSDPVKTTLVVDGTFSFETTDENKNFDCGFLAAGFHTLHIGETAASFANDTTFLCGFPNDFGNGNDYRFYVRGVPRTLTFPTAIGSTWRYKLSTSSYSTTNYLTATTTGTRVWTINSFSNDGSVTTLNLTDARLDSVDLDYDIGPVPDTSYISADTVGFTVVIDDSLIHVNSPEAAFTFAKSYAGGDTLRIAPRHPDYHSFSLYTLVDNVGLVHLDYGATGNSPFSVKMQLIEYLNR